jgi:hypothetical protein
LLECKDKNNYGTQRKRNPSKEIANEFANENKNPQGNEYGCVSEYKNENTKGKSNENSFQ